MKSDVRLFVEKKINMSLYCSIRVYFIDKNVMIKWTEIVRYCELLPLEILKGKCLSGSIYP